MTIYLFIYFFFVRNHHNYLNVFYVVKCILRFFFYFFEANALYHLNKAIYHVRHPKKKNTRAKLLILSQKVHQILELGK